jgi:hypothetical protein
MSYETGDERYSRQEPTTARTPGARFWLDEPVYVAAVISEALQLLLMGLYPVGFAFVLGFVAGKQHVRYLAKRGGEDRYPDRVGRIVRKYRREHNLGPRRDDD